MTSRTRPRGAVPGSPRVARRAVHGVLLLDKPLGLSSNQALQQARRLLRAEKAGHTGTLDPLATGLLPLCFGAATKFSQTLLEADKAYEATLVLGVATSTGDAEGEVTKRVPVQVNPADLHAALATWRGDIRQVPPMHSALKHEGRALYELARAGIEVDREARAVRIHSMDIVRWHGDTLVLAVRCSKGTYIRSLAQDIGATLGCGAHLAALRRTGTGGFGLHDAVTLQALEALPDFDRDAWLLRVDCLLGDAPVVRLDAVESGRFLTGLRRRGPWTDNPLVRVHDPTGTFLGSARVAAGELIPIRLLSPIEVVQALPPRVHPCEVTP